MKITGIVFLALSLSTWSCSQGNHNHLTKKERVLDSANLLTDSQEDSIFSLIRAIDTQIGSQIAIITIDTLNGKKIEQYSIEHAERLGLGRKQYDDGILITVALKDRQMRIEVGYGLEKIITNETADRIIREDMAPYFREARYCRGLYEAIAEIKTLIKANPNLVGQRP